MMDVDAILAPIPGDNPAGEDLRYTSTYEEIKSARQADDSLDRGAWAHALKEEDWGRVINVCSEALSKKSKDLQIALWLTEALMKTQGFDGLLTGLQIIVKYLSDYWDGVYPLIEDGDLDFRAAPILFMNDKLWPRVKEIALTDRRTANGYSWFKWEESRQVGYESELKNQYGDVDEKKKITRDELIADGKLTPEAFDEAVDLSTGAFYESLAGQLADCREQFRQLDQIVDERFGKDAPRLSEFGQALEDCEEVVSHLLKKKRGNEPTSESDSQGAQTKEFSLNVEERREEDVGFEPELAGESPSAARGTYARHIYESGTLEKTVWENALQTLKRNGIKGALAQVFQASCNAPSIREKNRYKLLMAQLCLTAKRPDLARPLLEQLNAVIEELNLERWESPIWIGEVLDAFCRCLSMGNPADEDKQRSRELLKKLCTIDVTKAVAHNL